MSTELFDAIDQQDLQQVATLLDQGADPNALLDESPHWRPLGAAIEEIAWYDGSLDLVRVLIERGADVNAWDGENAGTPLHAALNILNADMTVENKEQVQRDLLRLLLDAGANPNAVSDTGESALRWAVENGDLEMARLFLEFGASSTIDEFGGPCGETPLTLAARKLDVEMIELLIATGADPHALDEDRRSPLEKLPPREESSPETWDRAVELLSTPRSHSEQP